MKRLGITALVLAAFVLLGCRQTGQSLAGEYDCQRQGLSPARLLLRSDGGGALAVGAEEAPFRWELRGDGVVLLHTRQGGVILARQSAGGLELDLPGAGRQVFRKQ